MVPKMPSGRGENLVSSRSLQRQREVVATILGMLILYHRGIDNILEPSCDVVAMARMYVGAFTVVGRSVGTQVIQITQQCAVRHQKGIVRGR